MREGWHEETYWIVFDKGETKDITNAYGLAEFLPGYIVVGLLGWNDFVITDGCGALFRVPTIPLSFKYVEPLLSNPDFSELASDDRYAGKIKWHIQPLVFGGSPSSDDNLTWVDLRKHQTLVRWWNRKYLEVSEP
jgi:hypothetical protein